MTIGTQEHAAVAASIAGNNLPDGWSILGRGTYRIAYLGPDGTVYKIGNVRWADLDGVENVQQERNEAHNYDEMVRRLLDRNVTGWQVMPAHEYFVDGKAVVAQEVAPGELGLRQEPVHCDWRDNIEVPETDFTESAWDAFYEARRAARETHEATCEGCKAYSAWHNSMAEISDATCYWDIHSGNFTVDPETGMRYLFDYGGPLG